MENKFYSPFRYPGGKTKLVPFIASLLHENNLVGCEYVEPFAGGAGVALSLLFDDHASRITINDLDRSIYAFWHSTVHENERLCQKINETKITMETWYGQKEIQNNKEHANLFDLGFSTFYLNRTNVSGVIKGGVIGGKNQSGRYKMDARFNKRSLIRRIEKIHRYKDRITVENKDVLDLLSGCKNVFVYLDPPYVEKAKALYMNVYTSDGHKNIAQFLLSNKNEFPWLLSYDDNELIRDLYRTCNVKLSWKLRYGSSGNRVRELLFVSNNLNVDTAKKAVQYLEKGIDRQ